MAWKMTRTVRSLPRRLRTRLALGVVLALLAVPAVGAAPSTGAATTPWQALLPTQVHDVRAAVARTRTALADGGFEAALRGAMDHASGQADAPALPVPGARDLAAVAALPAAQRAPMAGLLAAVRTASGIIGTIPTSDFNTALAVISTTTPPRMKHTMVSVPGWEDAPRAGTVVEPSTGPTAASLPESIREASAVTPAASLLLARALDTYLPALAQHAASSGGAAVDGCDTLDALPLLCVGSEKDNRYTKDAALLVDMGGNDRYENTAGGAPFESGSALVPVSVNIDMAGNDTYLRARGSATEHVNTQGAGLLGGVGLLVDRGGNDTYTAHERALGEVRVGLLLSHGVSGWAQGVGASGVGALFDEGGTDAYESTADSSVRPLELAASLRAQGAALLGGVGLLVDRGSSPDSYVLDAGTLERSGDDQGSIAAQVIGQGGAQADSVGILSDEGGADRFWAGGATVWQPNDNDLVSFNGSPQYMDAMPALQIEAQGAGSAATGMLLTGSADTTYTIKGRRTGVAFVQASGQGFGSGYGVGVLDDAGGNDVYSTTSIGHHTQTVDIDETCETPPPGRISCYTPEARIDHLLAFDNIAFAQGSGWFGAALLDDHAGSDQYLTAVENYIDAHVRDRRTVASEPATMAVLSSNGQPTMGAQGSLDSNGHGQDVDTFAALIDHDGTDSYTARHIKAINADGSSVNGRQPQVRAESVYQIRIGAQGATFLPAGRPDAVGALLDLGGANDRFRAISDIPAVTAPDPSGAVELRAFRPSFQAGGAKGYPPVVESGAAGQAVFVADGANPSVVASPSQVTCTGTVRGYGTWRECRGTDAEGSFASPNSGPLDLYGASYGRAPSATGRATALAFVDPTTTRAGRSEAPRGLPFTVRLLDDDGQPLRGATVHVELDRASANAPWTGLVPQLSNSWNTGTGVDAVTDQDGIAMGQVPLPIIQPWVPNNPVYLEPEYRIFATYDGDTGLRPDFAAVSFRLD